MTLVRGADGRSRCSWSGTDPLYVEYHDTEWGVPVHGDMPLFERLTLEAFQSGLSWLIILRKRLGFRAAFAGFDIDTVAEFTTADIERCLSDPAIVRNRRKIEATVHNARALRAWRDREGDGMLDRCVWAHRPTEVELAAAGFTRPPIAVGDLPARTPASERLAKALKAQGLVFLGPTTVYAGMQANGLVDDHLAGCFRRGLFG